MNQAEMYSEVLDLADTISENMSESDVADALRSLADRFEVDRPVYELFPGTLEALGSLTIRKG